MSAIEIGPFVLAWPRFAAIAGALVLMAAAEVIGRLSGARAVLSSWAFHAVAWGALGARAAHVAESWPIYAEAPLGVLFFWQGGFAPWGAALAIGLVTLYFWRRAGLPLVPAFGALWTGAAVWGALMLDLGAQPAPALPALTLAALDGTPVELGPMPGEGRPVVLNLWATWCPPCRRELPMMLEVAATRDDVLFVFASQREEAATVAAYLERAGLSGAHVVLDTGGALSRHYGAVGLPVTLVHAPEGALVHTHVGEISRAALLSAIAKASAR